MKEIKKWKLISSEHICDEPWLSVYRNELELPNGKRINDYYTLEYPNWVNIMAITKDQKFVFVRQYRHGIGQVNFELCAGSCEDYDKNPLESAKRELDEETGYGNGNWSLYFECSANPSTHTNMVYTFLAIDVEKISEQHLEDTEDLEVYLFTFEEVKELLENNEIKQAVMCGPLWKYIAEQA